MDEDRTQLALKCTEFLERADYENAARYSKQLMALYPDYSISNYLTGRVLYRNGKLKEAINYLTRSISLDPTASGPYEYLGCALLLTADYESAFKNLLKASQLNQESVDIYCTLALTCIFLRKQNELHEYLKKALFKDPKRTMDWFNQFLTFAVIPATNLDSEIKIQIKHGIDDLQKLANAIEKQNKK